MLRGLLNSALRSGTSGRRGGGMSTGSGAVGNMGTGRRSRGYGGRGDVGGQVGAQVGRSLLSGLMRRR